jgi:hypothetical protein
MLTAVSWSPLGRVRLVSVIGRGGERNRAKQAPQSRSTAAARAQRSLLAASVAAASVSNEQLSRAVPAKIGSEWSLTEQPPSLLRLNAICPYFTMFPLDFPLDALAGARPHEWVLDPFCGRGTTLFAARLCGLGAVGVDVNPVATALAAAKLVRIRPETIVRRCRELLRNGYEPIEIPDGEFWGTCFHPGTLVDLCRLREQLLRAPGDASTVALRGLVLGVLHGPLRKGLPTYLSNQMPRTYATKPAAALRYWRARDMHPPGVDVLDVIRRRARFTLADLPARVPGLVRCGDAAAEIARLRQSFSWIITSPPYYGMRTYLPDQWLRAWFSRASAQSPVLCGGADHPAKRGCICDTPRSDMAGGRPSMCPRCASGRPVRCAAIGREEAGRPTGGLHHSVGLKLDDHLGCTFGCAPPRARPGPAADRDDVAGVPAPAGRWDPRLRLLHRRHRLAAAPVRAVPASNWTPAGSTWPG